MTTTRAISEDDLKLISTFLETYGDKSLGELIDKLTKAGDEFVENHTIYWCYSDGMHRGPYRWTGGDDYMNDDIKFHLFDAVYRSIQSMQADVSMLRDLASRYGADYPKFEQTAKELLTMANLIREFCEDVHTDDVCAARHKILSMIK